MDPIALRDLAHELRQPLSTIEAIAYYLAMVLPPDDEKTHEQLERLQHLVEQSNWILSNSLNLSDAAAPVRECVDLDAMVAEAAANRPELRLELAGGCTVDADRSMARALVENLLTLARQAGEFASVRTVRAADGVALEVESGGALRSVAGGALSIASARRIAEAHGGALEIAPEAAGARIRVVLP